MAPKVVGRTPYESIAGGFYLQDLFTDAGVSVSLRNRTKHWIFREDDTRPHWPPWGPDTPLHLWAMQHGIPPFLVARKIAREGTEGNHIVRDAWERWAPMRQQAVQGGLYAYTLNLGAVA